MDTATVVRNLARDFAQVLANMRFLDLVPEAMRQPSLPGQLVLGDRGEHLASVLQEICQDARRKQTLLSWLQELTPADALDLDFLYDYSGKVLLLLKEANAQKISASSASDGTLRFMAILASLLTPKPAQLYFFKEIENGLHPTRLYLLLDFIQKQATSKVIATSHSPQILRFLNVESRDNVALIYRPPNSPTAHIKQLRDFPTKARQVIEQQDLAELHDSGWFENTVFFMQGED